MPFEMVRETRAHESSRWQKSVATKGAASSLPRETFPGGLLARLSVLDLTFDTGLPQGRIHSRLTSGRFVRGPANTFGTGVPVLNLLGSSPYLVDPVPPSYAKAAALSCVKASLS